MSVTIPLSEPGAPAARIFVLHENEAWVEPLREALDARGLPFAEWFLDRGTLDLAALPPAGVFYNRMSASSHTRGHDFAPEYTAAVLAWLESHGRRVVNTSRALALEVSKVAQYAALEAAGIQTPRTVAAVGRAAILAAAAGFEGPFITKHNRAGKGLGVHLFESTAALAAHLESDAFEDSRDGITLIQAYIESPAPYITRVEFVGGEPLYAVRVDTSQGFELCPADACRIEDRACPADGGAMFTLTDEVDPGLVRRYQRFLAANGIEIAGIEFIVDRHGTPYTYDVNTNTNYNPQAEAAAGVPGRGMGAIADFLCRELARVSGRSWPCATAAE